MQPLQLPPRSMSLNPAPAVSAGVFLSIYRYLSSPRKINCASDAFCLFYSAKTHDVKALNGSGRSPQKLTIEYARQRGLEGQIPHTDLNSVTVPGLALAKDERAMSLNSTIC